MLTGGLGGAGVGALVGGPVGAIVGGGIGVAGGAALDKSADEKINEWANAPRDDGRQIAAASSEPRSGSADRGRAWSKDQVHEKLHDVGYESVYNIRPQGDVYMARGERDGRAYDIRVDSYSGRIMASNDVGQARRLTRSGDASGMISDQQVRNSLRQDGYDRVGNVQRSGNNYQVQAARGNSIYNVTVDGRTGRIVSAAPAMQTGGAPGTAALSDDQVKGALQRDGYTQVSDLRREGNTVVGQARRDGRAYTVRVDSQTGRIIGSEPAGTETAQPPQGG